MLHVVVKVFYWVIFVKTWKVEVEKNSQPLNYSTGMGQRQQQQYQAKLSESLNIVVETEKKVNLLHKWEIASYCVLHDSENAKNKWVIHFESLHEVNRISVTN